MQGVCVCLSTEKESKISTSSLYSAPSAIIVVDPVNIVVPIFSYISHPRPYSSNQKDACKHHASKCADHLCTQNMNRFYWKEQNKFATCIDAIECKAIYIMSCVPQSTIF